MTVFCFSLVRIAVYIRSMAAYDIPIKLSAKNFCSFKYIEVTSIYSIPNTQNIENKVRVVSKQTSSTFEHDPAFSKHQLH